MASCPADSGGVAFCPENGGGEVWRATDVDDGASCTGDCVGEGGRAVTMA